MEQELKYIEQDDSKDIKRQYRLYKGKKDTLKNNYDKINESIVKSMKSVSVYNQEEVKETPMFIFFLSK